MADRSDLVSPYYLSLEGEVVPSELAEAVVGVTVETSLQLPAMAEVVIEDTALRWIDDDRLMPGAALRVTASVRGGEALLFDGEVVELEPRFDASTQTLSLRAFDRMHRLGIGAAVRTFQDVTDGDLLERLAAEAGLRGEAAQARGVHAHVFQAAESSLALLRRRARARGWLLWAEGETVRMTPAEGRGAPLRLAWQEDLLAFSPRLTSLEQVAEVEVRGWDAASKRAVVGRAGGGEASPRIGLRADGGDLASTLLGGEARRVVPAPSIDTEAGAERMARAEAERAASRFVEAEGLAAGSPYLVAGRLAEIANVGDRFGGTYLVTSARHELTHADGYTTAFSVTGLGLPALLVAPDDAPPPAFGRAGLAVGIVTDNADPEGLGRVRVRYPVLSDAHASGWARLAVPGGGAGRGLMVVPEVEDEVVVGFVGGDLGQPYVLGGLWNGVDAPPGGAVEGGKVRHRALRTRAGHAVSLDDGSPGGITISDAKGNAIALDASTDGLTISVAGDVAIEAGGALSLRAGGAVTLEGARVGVKGQASVDVEGGVINLN